MPSSSGASIAAAPGQVSALLAAPLCSSAFALAWEHGGGAQDGFEIERAGDFDPDRAWRLIGRAPASARRFESVGLPGGGGRSWRHRVRAVSSTGAGPWSECASATLPASPGGPRGRLIVPSTSSAPRNISGSLVALANGDVLYAYTASGGMMDYARSWIPAMTMTPEGCWRERGILFDTRQEFPVVSRPSFARMADGRILSTYSIGRPLRAGAADDDTDQTFHRVVSRCSADEGATWSPERVISDEVYDYELVNSNGVRISILSNGRIITHAHCHNPAPLRAFDPTKGARFTEVMGTYLQISDDQGRTWRRYPRERDRFLFVAGDPSGRGRNGFHEISIVEHAPGALLMYGRTATGWFYESRSSDYGTTWSEPAPSSVSAPIAPANLTRIPGTSTIALLYNPIIDHSSEWHGGARFILASRLSDDGGRTWHGYREIEYDGAYDGAKGGELRWYMYPDFLWVGDDLHLVYNRGFRDLYHQRLGKEWLLGR